VGGFHFYNSHFKADFVLLGLIAMAFAPWLGHVFESVGKDGFKYRAKQGEVPSAPPVSPEAPNLPVSNSPVPGAVAAPSASPPSGTGSDGQATRSNLLPAEDNIDQRIATLARYREILALDVPFEGFSNDAKKILATFWKYQQVYIPPSSPGRWTFIINPQAPDYENFARGMGELSFHQFMGLAGNGQFALTSRGLDYCRRHSAEISAWPFRYDKFDN
jgi:hypothetical protein